MLASSSHPMAAIRWARSAIEAGNVPLAFERLEGVETSAARALRAYCLVEMGECARAVREYRFLLRRGRRTLDVLINMGVALARLGSLEKAMSVTRQATLLSPANTVASHNLARYLLSTGDRGGAVRELARVSSAVPGDYKSALYSAWARANFLHDHRGALAALLDARARFARSGDDAARAEIAGSIAFLQFLLGEIDRPRARRSLVAALELAEFASGDLARMYATFLERTSDLPALDDLLARAGNSVDDLDRALLETRRALLARDPETATARALDAASLDSEAGTEAAATAAYLVGEVTGDYLQGAAIAERAFRRSPDVPLANNFAFSLALAGEPRRAMRVLDQFAIEELPFHGATVALTLLCLGAIDEGMALYGRAIEMTLADGDPTTAGYMRLRARIALRQVGAGHPDASPASILEAWPRDAGDPRWEVMRRVAQRTGVVVPDAGALSR